MTRRGGTGLRAVRHPVVVVAGEDRNDRQCLRILLEDLCPDMSGRIVEINDSVRLRDATGANLQVRVSTLARKIRARSVREGSPVACVFVHEDLDRADGVAYDRTYARVQESLLRSFSSAHYVLSVWEMEAWLLLFPEALQGLVQAWSVPAKYRRRDTGTLTDPKRILSHELGHPKRRYRESDAPEIFQMAVQLGCLARPAGTNRSWAKFHTDAAACCRQHLDPPTASAP